jgi:hypothetical protein
MPMGIVSDKDFSDELTRASSDAKKPLPEIISPVLEGQIVDVNRGRPVGSVEVPNSLRKVIGEESAINGRQSAIELAETFGLSPSSVSAYANGATSTATYDETPNRPHINIAKDKITKRAFSTLSKAIKHITEDKLIAAKAKDLAGIAKDMAAVVRTMEPEVKGPTNVNNGPTFVFYSPQQRKEEAFDVVYAKE